MTSNALRKEVLRSFKNLHRARCIVFKNSEEHLVKVRKEINDAFKKNKDVTNTDSIKEMINVANAVALELKTTVVEMEQTGEGRFRLIIRPEMFEESIDTKNKT